jgi:hypothetical protein
MTTPFEDGVEIKLCARVVEFVAKPEKTNELRGLLCKAVTRSFGIELGLSVRLF